MRNEFVVLGIILILVGVSIFYLGDNGLLPIEDKQMDTTPKIEIMGDPSISISNTPEGSKATIKFTLKNLSSVNGKAKIMIYVESNENSNYIIEDPYEVPGNSTLPFDYEVSLTNWNNNEKIKLKIIEQWKV